MRIFSFFASVVFLCGCQSKNNLVHIYSPNESQCLTLITEGNIQYLINGEHNEVPDSQYVKIDIDDRDLVVENSLHVCWGDVSPISWDVVISSSKVLENRLDSTKFRFRTELPISAEGVSTEIKFRKNNCAVILLDLGRTSPPSGTKVIIR